jgi:hypothetical protein
MPSRTPLTQAEFDQLCLADDWEINEVDLKTIQATKGIARKKDVIGAYSSGDANAAKTLNNQEAIFGMDVIVHEQNPMREKNEGDVNVYHYIVKRTTRADYPYLMFGPYAGDTLMGHWPTDLDVEVYFRPAQQ